MASHSGLNRTVVDLSSTPDGEFLVAGAYVASPERWDKFSGEWSQILTDAGVPHFHATDFFSGHKHFKHVPPSSPKHIELAKRFTRTVVTHCGVGVAFGLHVPTFEEIVKPALAAARVPNGGLTPEMLAVGSCLSKLATLILAELPGFRANVILEDGTRMGGVVEWIRLQQLVATNPLTVFHDISRQPKERIELQAADLLAHESARHIRSLVLGDGRPLRKSFEVLISTKQVEVGYAERETLEAELPRLAAQLALHPEYQARALPPATT